METTKKLEQNPCPKRYLPTILYAVGAFLGVLIPFAYYLSLAWVSTHSSTPACPGTVRVPNFNPLESAILLSSKIEQLWLLIFGLFLLCTGSWYSFKDRRFY